MTTLDLDISGGLKLESFTLSVLPLDYRIVSKVSAKSLIAPQNCPAMPPPPKHAYIIFVRSLI